MKNPACIKSIDHRDNFGLFLNDLGFHGQGVEVGVFAGKNAYSILSKWARGMLFLVDPWELNHNRLVECLKRLEGFQSRYRIIREKSPGSAQQFQDGQLDFVYIDADHRHEPVLADLEAWIPKVKPGGIVAGHDYGPISDREGKYVGPNGVAKAVKKVQSRLNVLVHSTPCTSFWFMKPF